MQSSRHLSANPPSLLGRLSSWSLLAELTLLASRPAEAQTLPIGGFLLDDVTMSDSITQTIR